MSHLYLTAVCVLFLFKLKWPKNNSFYDLAKATLSGYREVFCVQSRILRIDFINSYPAFQHYNEAIVMLPFCARNLDNVTKKENVGRGSWIRRIRAILGFHVTSEKKIKFFSFYLYQVKVIFEHISVSLSSAR